MLMRSDFYLFAADDVEPEWEVAAIEGERRYKNGIQCLVRWKGYAERTWEAEDYLENAPTTIVAEWRSTRPDGDELKGQNQRN